MTGNQTHALDLARGILQGKVVARDLPDADWHLLLLAAGLNNYCSLPLLVAHLILRNAESSEGYFAQDREPRRVLASA